MISLRSPMQALFWKEWRTLRHLRWACIGLGALLPLFFFAGAAMGRSGLSPFGRASVWSTARILRDVVPGSLAFALWPFATLILITQAFVGDRAAGTEAFLLERPITRRRVWAVRLAASTFSAATVVAGTVFVWMALALASGGVAPQGWKGPISMFALGGMILLVTAPCAALASSLLASPLLALLTSALLAGLPAVLSVGLAGLFPYAGRPEKPIGGLVPWLLIPLYLAVAYIASTSGEPAGRGRPARGIGGLTLAVLATLFVFVTSAQALLRREAVRPHSIASLSAAPEGDRAILKGQWGGLWLVDTKTGAILEHFPRPCNEAAWNADGSMFAIGTCAGPLGSTGRCRVSLFDRDGKPSTASWLASPDEDVLRLFWGRGSVFFMTSGAKSGSALVAFDPWQSAAARQAMNGPLGSWDYVGTLWDGTTAIAKVLPEEPLDNPRIDPGETRIKESRFGLFRFDPRSGVLDPEPLIADHGATWRARFFALSPSGRWYQPGMPKPMPQEMVDLETGERVPPTPGGWPDDPIRWYLQPDGDATSVIEARQGSEPRSLRSWPRAALYLMPSPDRRHLLIRLWHDKKAARAAGERRVEDWLYDSISGSWTQLPLPPAAQEMETPFSGVPWRSWVGPGTFALRGPDALGFEDVEGPSNPRYVFGGP